MVSGLLSGLRVLDLTRFVSGSQATMLLAAMGADVIKIEVPPGDPYRWQGTERVGAESALFLALNAGKRSVAIDFRARRPAGARAGAGVGRHAGGELPAGQPDGARAGLGVRSRLLPGAHLRLHLGLR